MYITWEKSEDVLYYVVYRSDTFTIPNGYLVDSVCVCSDDFVTLDIPSDIYLSGVDEKILPYLNPPDGFEIYQHTTENYLDVPEGFYTVVAVYPNCVSGYSTLIKVGASDYSTIKTISFSACGFVLTKIDSDHWYRNIRSPRWGLQLNKIDFSFNYDITSDNSVILELDLYSNSEDMSNIIYSKVFSDLSGSGTEVISATISKYHPPDEDIILVVKPAVMSGGSIGISDLSVTLTGYIRDIPREILSENIKVEERVDRWSLTNPASSFRTIGGYSGGGFFINKAYKTPSDGSSSCKVIVDCDGLEYDIFLPIEEPLLIMEGSNVTIEGSGDPFVSTFHIGERATIDIENIIASKDVFFDGGTLNWNIGSFDKTFYFNGKIVYIDIWKIGASPQTLTITGPSIDMNIPLTRTHVKVPIDIDFSTGDILTFSWNAENMPNCIDVRFEYWRRSIIESCECEEQERPMFAHYDFEDVIMFDGVGGTRFRTYQMNFDCKKIIIQPYRGYLVGNEWNLTILEDGAPLRSFTSSEDTREYIEDVDIKFKQNKSYTFILEGSDASYSEGPPDVCVYLRGDTDGILYVHGIVTTYDSIDKHIPSSSDGESWVEARFSYPFPIDLYAVGVTCDDADIGDWELLIPDYDIDVSGTSGERMKIIDTPTHISAYTNFIFRHKIEGFPTVNLFYIKRTEWIDPSTRYYCTTEGGLLKSTDYAGGFILPYKANDPLHYIELEMSLSHPPISDIAYELWYYNPVDSNWYNFGMDGTILSGQNYVLKERHDFSLDPSDISLIKLVFPDGWSEESSIFVNCTLGSIL